MTTPHAPYEGFTTKKLGGLTLTVDFDEHTITLRYQGFLSSRHEKKLGDIVIPFAEIDHLDWDSTRFARIILHRWRDDRTQNITSDVSIDPLVFQVDRKKDRQEIQDLFDAIASIIPNPSSGTFTRPPIKSTLLLPKFGDVHLEGNDIVHKGKRYPIAGAGAEVDAGTGGGGGLSVGRAIVGGALLGGAGAVLGGVTGKKGQVMLGVQLASGRTIVTSDSVKKLDTAIDIVNDISEWSAKLEEPAGDA